MPAVQIQCAQCSCYNTYVVMTNNTKQGIIRRRKCKGCEYRWYTYQPSEVVVPPDKIITKLKKPTLKAEYFSRNNTIAPNT